MRKGVECVIDLRFDATLIISFEEGLEYNTKEDGGGGKNYL